MRYLKLLLVLLALLVAWAGGVLWERLSVGQSFPLRNAGDYEVTCEFARFEELNRDIGRYLATRDGKMPTDPYRALVESRVVDSYHEFLFSGNAVIFSPMELPCRVNPDLARNVKAPLCWLFRPDIGEVWACYLDGSCEREARRGTRSLTSTSVLGKAGATWRKSLREAGYPYWVSLAEKAKWCQEHYDELVWDADKGFYVLVHQDNSGDNAQSDAPEAPQQDRPTVTAEGAFAAQWLKCSFGEVKDGKMRVDWEFRNVSGTDVWIPVKFDVTERPRPQSELPFMFLVPGGRVLSVAGMFSKDYSVHVDEEGWPKVELVRVASGDSITGHSTVALPFTWEDRPDNRPNPFTSWRTRNSAPPPFDVEILTKAMEIRRITGFQMAMQVYRLPHEVITDSRSDYPPHGPAIGDDRLIISGNLPFDVIKDCEESGRYWASSLARIENRWVRITDFAEWVLSPVYAVDWPVGTHPPVGVEGYWYDEPSD